MVEIAAVAEGCKSRRADANEAGGDLCGARRGC